VSLFILFRKRERQNRWGNVFSKFWLLELLCNGQLNLRLSVAVFNLLQKRRSLFMALSGNSVTFCLSKVAIEINDGREPDNDVQVPIKYKVAHIHL
jgi:hypothetical protein